MSTNTRTMFQRADLETIIDATVPECPDCKWEYSQTMAIETWQLVCLTCLGRWGTTWRPSRAKESADE